MDDEWVDDVWVDDVWRGMKSRGNAFAIDCAPTGRARCRACKGRVSKGEVRLVTYAAVCTWPRRSTVLVRHARCVNAAFARAVLDVHGAVDHVPVVGDVDHALVAEARKRLDVYKENANSK